MGSKRIRQRSAGVIIKDRKILLFRRVRDGREYFVFPGGGVEAGESHEAALARELNEELCITIDQPILLFETEQSLDHYGEAIIEHAYYYLVESYTGIPELGGPEKEIMTEQNQYHLVWVSLSEIDSMSTLYPTIAVEKLIIWMRSK